MAQQQREFEQLRDKELAEAQRLEQEELRRKQEKVGFSANSFRIAGFYKCANARKNV